MDGSPISRWTARPDEGRAARIVAPNAVSRSRPVEPPLVAIILGMLTSAPHVSARLGRCPDLLARLQARNEKPPASPSGVDQLLSGEAGPGA